MGRRQEMDEEGEERSEMKSNVRETKCGKRKREKGDEREGRE